jgi:tight adherence protein B
MAEILSNLAYIIRERFRIRGQVKAASAHGRLTAGILTVMPIVTLLALLVVAPGYIQALANDEDGKWLLVYAVISQLIGYYIIRRIVDIKV